MDRNLPTSSGDDRPACVEDGCDLRASFWAYDADCDHWIPMCERHARVRRHSIEIHAWLESGYMKPIELEQPEGDPEDPPTRRGVTFKQSIDEAMGWDS